MSCLLREVAIRANPRTPFWGILGPRIHGVESKVQRQRTRIVGKGGKFIRSYSILEKSRLFVCRWAGSRSKDRVVAGCRVENDLKSRG